MPGRTKPVFGVIAVVALALMLVGRGAAASVSHTSGLRALTTTAVSRVSATVASGLACDNSIRAASLSAITFLNATTGLGVWSQRSQCGPRLAVTHDGGEKWRVIGGKLPAPITNFSAEATPTMIFPTTRVGWILGSGALITTRDGGSSWTRVSFGGFVAVISRSGNSLWAFVAPCLANPTACSYRLEATTLNGRTFHKVGLLPSSLGNFLPLVVTRLSPERALVAVGQMGASPAVLTADGGKRWSSVTACTPSGFVAVAFATTGTADVWVLCLGGGGMSNSMKSLARSIDGGKKWSLIGADRSLAGPPGPIPSEPGDVFAVPSNTRLWIMTTYRLYGSADGGKRWFWVPGTGSDGAGSFATFSFVNATHGWLLAPGSGLWRTTDGRNWRTV